MKASAGGGVLLAAFVLGAVGFTPGLTWSCTCIPPPLELALAQATFIAVGHVTAVRESAEGGILHNIVSVTVPYGWKGILAANLDLVTGQWDGDCGYPFLVGHDYLLVGGQSPFDLAVSISLCSYTLELRDADSVLRVLGPAPIVAVESVTWSGLKAMHR